MLQVKSYYLRIKKKVTLAPAELLLSWPGLVLYVRLPKPGAIGTRGLFRLCNSSFESP